MDYKVGDKVICVNNDQYGRLLTMGKEYRVESVSTIHVRVIGDRGGVIDCFSDRFKPADVEHFVFVVGGQWPKIKHPSLGAAEEYAQRFCQSNPNRTAHIFPCDAVVSTFQSKQELVVTRV